MIKDQSGVGLSEIWLRERGLGTYSSHETSGSFADRVTRPITREWYDLILKGNECPRCRAALTKAGSPSGGSYMSCSTGWQCYHIGWRDDQNKGEERIT